MPMRRKRLPFTKEEKCFLMQCFSHNINPDMHERKQISLITHISIERVRNWFQNQRAQLRKNETGISMVKQIMCDPPPKYEFFSDCNALCIEPNAYNVEKYKARFANSTKNPAIIAKLDWKTGWYSLGYW